jgi:hypothetical protein
VLEYGIVGFFDNIDHELLMKALDRHHPDRWGDGEPSAETLWRGERALSFMAELWRAMTTS